MNRFDSFSSFSEKVPCRSEWPYLRPVIFLEKVGGHLVSNFAISGNVSHYENTHMCSLYFQTTFSSSFRTFADNSSIPCYC